MAQNNDRLAHKLAASKANNTHMVTKGSTTKHYVKGQIAKTRGSANALNLFESLEKEIDEDCGEVLQLMKYILDTVKEPGTVYESPETKRRCGTKQTEKTIANLVQERQQLAEAGILVKEGKGFD